MKREHDLTEEENRLRAHIKPVFELFYVAVTCGGGERMAHIAKSFMYFKEFRAREKVFSVRHMNSMFSRHFLLLPPFGCI